ncbi:benzoate transporter [Aureimonas sp. Leaf454]|uniref:benzoate/H(+) symporter BenE family transporter n=1 Tax=Aureimonas sp. Leaf454 TaxID=1736381 RepID=UPI0006FAD4E7|nr:benzoate/H(+) symporter BenE family transporter [Aureimonas sp. Leaf454]KQT45148.1 benzoate transporter [Aureimonas sp. Leaf454]
MTHPPTTAAVSAGLLAAFVGFASSFAVILQGLTAVGASKEEAASGLMALSIAMGLCGILFSLRTKMPISVAWSTPGAALLATSALPEGGFPAAVGAFIVAAALVVASGLFRPLGRIIAAIPASIASAMLAGVVFGLCLAPVRAVASDPLSGLMVAGSWLVMTRIRRLLAVPVAAIVAVVVIIAGKGVPGADATLLPHPIFVLPTFDPTDIIGLSLPLFLVTMASQNIPGLAILRVNGYAPEAGSLFRTTGLFSAVSALFGGHAVNIAAITAAICAGDEAGPDREGRYWAAVVSGGGYVVFGLAAGLVAAFAALEPVLIQAVAGLALIGAFTGALQAAMARIEEREAATVTFLVTASGIAFLGISSAFWGLLAGAAVLAVTRIGRAPG